MTTRISVRRLLAGGAALGTSGVAAASTTPTPAPSGTTADHHGHHDRCEWKKGHWEKNWVPGHWVKKWVHQDNWQHGHHHHGWVNKWVYVPGHWDHVWVKGHWDCRPHHH
jgi:hypothetical protein